MNSQHKKTNKIWIYWLISVESSHRVEIRSSICMWWWRFISRGIICIFELVDHGIRRLSPARSFRWDTWSSKPRLRSFAPDPNIIYINMFLVDYFLNKNSSDSTWTFLDDAHDPDFAMTPKGATHSIAINHGVNAETQLFSLKRGSVLHIKPSASMLGRRVALYCNLPVNGMYRHNWSIVCVTSAVRITWILFVFRQRRFHSKTISAYQLVQSERQESHQRRSAIRRHYEPRCVLRAESEPFWVVSYLFHLRGWGVCFNSLIIWFSLINNICLFKICFV